MLPTLTATMTTRRRADLGAVAVLVPSPSAPSVSCASSRPSDAAPVLVPLPLGPVPPRSRSAAPLPLAHAEPTGWVMYCSPVAQGAVRAIGEALGAVASVTAAYAPCAPLDEAVGGAARDPPMHASADSAEALPPS
jgi:hypothetical protein